MQMVRALYIHQSFEAPALTIQDSGNTGEKLRDMLRTLRAGSKRIKMWKSHRQLATIKGEQRARFVAQAGRFSDIYSALRENKASAFVTPIWERFNAELEKVFLPRPPFSFLRHPTIMRTMFMTAGGKWLREELTFLENKVSKAKLRSLLVEDYVGEPLLLNSTYLTSHGSIHNLYHLIRFSDKTGCDLNQISSVVEWGGGYGNLAKLFKRLSDNEPTYIIIDTPLFSCIQWLYLSTVVGEQYVHLLQNAVDSIVPEKLNLVPICFLDNCQIKGDIFISTWGLSESSEYAQDLVMSKKWFGARHLLLGYQDRGGAFPYGDRVGILAAQHGAVIEDIGFLPGNHYAFR